MSLHRRCFVGAILFAMWTSGAAAQPGFTGTWSAGGQNTALLVLTVKRSRLVGTVEDREIYDGRVNGNTITFKVTSPDEDRTITFTGTNQGDDIAFTRSVQVRDGGSPGIQGIFSVAAPLTFTARRAVWTAGTELAVAVNPHGHDVKGEGLLFLPQKASNIRALIVVIGWGFGFEG